MKSFNLAAVSLKSLPCNPTENLKRHIPWIAKAKENNCDLICFPEISITGFFDDYKPYWEAAEKINAKSTEAMIGLAQKYKITIGYGIAEKSDTDLVYNSYCFVSPNGFLGAYRKVHIPIFEYPIESSGSDFNVINLGFVKAGVNTCFDNWFSESGRMSYLNGAEIIIAPFWMQWGDYSIKNDKIRAFNDWKALAMKNFPSVAWQNGVYHITINSCGGIEEGNFSYHGPSLLLVIDPHGDLVAESDRNISDEQMIIQKIDNEKLMKRRSEALFHPKYRKPCMYGKICHSA